MSASTEATDPKATENDTVHVELDAMRTCATAMETLGEEARLRTLGWLVQRYGNGSPQGLSSPLTAPNPGNVPANTAGNVQVTPKKFVQEKAPKTDVERIAVLAYYLGRYRDKPHFKTADLTALNTEAAQPRFSNAADAASNAVKGSGLLTDAGKGLRQLTVKGEEIVEALPSREAVGAVVEKYGTLRRRRTARASKDKGED